ncbi:MAG TPA: hypothetical protein VMB47_10985 [Candidatus Aquilonibacter sp.]|nr:hypothetical protein [Candidatus Aquilonibacter sp.]
MFRHQLRSFIFGFALIISITFAAPSLLAQEAPLATPGTAAFDALPAALSPSLSSASAVTVTYRTQSFEAITIPAEQSAKAVRNVAVESFPSRRNWLILSFVSSGAAEFDAYSTRRSIGAGNVEADPTMRPFVNSPVIYGAIQASPLVMDYVAFKMQRSHNPFLRHLWWLPQTTGTAVSLFAGAHNLSIAH